MGRSPLFRIHLSVPLLLEYEAVLKRRSKVPVTSGMVDDVLDYLCSVAELHEIFFCGVRSCAIRQMTWCWRLRWQGRATEL